MMQGFFISGDNGGVAGDAPSSLQRGDYNEWPEQSCFLKISPDLTRCADLEKNHPHSTDFTFKRPHL